jgi:hypothetical protein
MSHHLIRAAAIAFVALQPMVAMASPTPSPALDGLLAAPPASTYSELPATTTGILEGAFDAKTYVAASGTPDPVNDQKALENDGFLSGFGKTWVQRSTGHVFVEAVIAFTGGDGANTWMRQNEAADKKQTAYKNSLTVDGVPAYYGAHSYDPAAGAYSDGFVVVKGNDAFLVIFASRKDDLTNLASTQAKKQYDAAPDLTIPRSQWPQPAVDTNSLAYKLGRLLPGLIFVLLLVLVSAFIYRQVQRSRRTAVLATPMYGALPGTAPAPVPSVQMSDDRRFWWDGAAWRDAEHEVPPAAQRSGDGNFWWDGFNWRPVAGPGVGGAPPGP